MAANGSGTSCGHASRSCPGCPRTTVAGLGTDLLAGTVVAALIIPQALGYAGIAGVPVQVGLYAIPLALLAYAVFGLVPPARRRAGLDRVRPVGVAWSRPTRLATLRLP